MSIVTGSNSLCFCWKTIRRVTLYGWFLIRTGYSRITRDAARTILLGSISDLTYLFLRVLAGLRVESDSLAEQVADHCITFSLTAYGRDAMKLLADKCLTLLLTLVASLRFAGIFGCVIALRASVATDTFHAPSLSSSHLLLLRAPKLWLLQAYSLPRTLSSYEPSASALLRRLHSEGVFRTRAVLRSASEAPLAPSLHPYFYTHLNHSQSSVITRCAPLSHSGAHVLHDQNHSPFKILTTFPKRFLGKMTIRASEFLVLVLWLHHGWTCRLFRLV